MTKLSNEAIYQAAAAIYCAWLVACELPDGEQKSLPSLNAKACVTAAKRLAALIEEGE